jgi:hypothetical protein
VSYFIAKTQGRLAYGPRSDGNVTLDGVATVPWASLAGSTYTMSRNCYCDNLTINSGITLATAGYAVFADVLAGSGTISRVGNAASGTTAGAALTGAWLGQASEASAGGAGRTTSGAGTAGTALGSALGGSGGAGGNSGQGQNGGGAGTATAPTSVVGSAEDPATAFAGHFMGTSGGALGLRGGCGGGGGGSDGGGGGSGGGGGGGGVIFVAARSITFTGTVTAAGGAGAAATGVGNNGGGGGGGGGAIVAVTDTTGTLPWTTSVAGGAGGGATGTGAAGSTGAAGATRVHQPPA